MVKATNELCPVTIEPAGPDYPHDVIVVHGGENPHDCPLVTNLPAQTPEITGENE